MLDLNERNGLFFPKSNSFIQSQMPFTGEIEGFDRGYMKSGKKEGYWARYYSFTGKYTSDLFFYGGQLEKEGFYRNGKKEGSWVYYWTNGEIMDRGTYKDGMRTGHWKSFLEDGTVVVPLTGVFVNGEKVSE